MSSAKKSGWMIRGALLALLLCLGTYWIGVQLFPSLFLGHFSEAKTEFFHLPIMFEKNEGQVADNVQFLSKGPNYTLFLNREEVVISLLHDMKVEQMATGVKMEFQGANKEFSPKGEAPLKAKSNYFWGNDKSKWLSNVPQYEKVTYKGIYPGIDLSFVERDRKRSYCFFVAAQAEYRPIRLYFTGTNGMSVDDKGALRASIDEGGAVFLQTLTIAEVGKEGKKNIPGKFVILSQDQFGATIGLQVDDYDHSKILDISISLEYTTPPKGNSQEYGFNIALDKEGNAFVTGFTSYYDYPQTIGVYQINPKGEKNAFIAGLNPNKNELLFFTYLGGDKYDYGHDIATDAQGNIYVAGYTSSPDFPTTPGAFQEKLKGSQNAFVSKIAHDGAELLYSTFLGGEGEDYGYGVAVDGAGDIFVSGTTYSPDFPATPGSFQTKSSSGKHPNVFVTKLNPTKSILLYSTLLGGTEKDYGADVSIDKEGNAYVTGYTYSHDYPTTPNAFQKHLKGETNAFISKISAAGDELLYSTYLGGKIRDTGNRIVTDVAGNAFVTGSASSSDFPTTEGVYQKELKGATNIFLTKVNAAGSGLLFSTLLGGSGQDYGYGAAVNAAGNAYLTGYSYSADFPTTKDAFQRTLQGTPNAVMVEFNAKGSALLYSSYLGGKTFDFGYGIALSHEGDALVTGSTSMARTSEGSDRVNKSEGAFVTEFLLGSRQAPQ